MTSTPARSTTFDNISHPIRDVVTAFGGDPKDTAGARADGWARIISFLGASLDAPRKATEPAQLGVEQKRVAAS